MLTVSTLRNKLASGKMSLLNQTVYSDILGKNVELSDICDAVPRMFHNYSQNCPKNVTRNLDKSGFGEFIFEEGILSCKKISPTETQWEIALNDGGKCIYLEGNNKILRRYENCDCIRQSIAEKKSEDYCEITYFLQRPSQGIDYRASISYKDEHANKAHAEATNNGETVMQDFLFNDDGKTISKFKTADGKTVINEEYYPDGKRLKRRTVFNLQENCGYVEGYDVNLNLISKKKIYNIDNIE